MLITDTYERRCAITSERVLPVLEAAHVKAVASGGDHQIQNGVLLRTDVHRLFDKGYVGIRPGYTIQVSDRLRSEFANGEYYKQFAGSEIWVPPNQSDRPDPELLEWHMDSVYRAS